MKTSVFIANSLDGYIARNDGAIDWLNAANEMAPPGEDCGYAAFMSTIDVIIMGRNTFELVLSFGGWHYGDKRLIVLSRKPYAIPAHVPKTVTASSESPAALLQRLSAEGATHAYVDGGLTIQSFLRAGLINDITITLIPVILGEGKPLFGSVAADVHLRSISSHRYDFGFVQIKYAVVASEVKIPPKALQAL